MGLISGEIPCAGPRVQRFCVSRCRGWAERNNCGPDWSESMEIPFVSWTIWTLSESMDHMYCISWPAQFNLDHFLRLHLHNRTSRILHTVFFFGLNVLCLICLIISKRHLTVENPPNSLNKQLFCIEAPPDEMIDN